MLLPKIDNVKIIRHGLLMFFTLLCLASMSCSNNNNEYNGSENDAHHHFSVLFIGSSFGVNTFVAFPALAVAAGLDFYGLNLYKGSCTLSDIRHCCETGIGLDCGAYFSSDTKRWISTSSSIIDALKDRCWDVIILQRAAPGQIGGSDRWDNAMREDLRVILSFISDNVSNKPSILFNSSFSLPICKMASRESQRLAVNTIMATCKEIKEEFGLEIIPSAIAIQYARETELSLFPTSNSNCYVIPDLTGSGDHLDIGIGSYVLGCLLYEQIVGRLFEKSISDLSYIPALSDVSNNAAHFKDSDYTPFGVEQSVIAKEAALYAFNNPWAKF